MVNMRRTARKSTSGRFAGRLKKSAHPEEGQSQPEEEPQQDQPGEEPQEMAAEEEPQAQQNDGTDEPIDIEMDENANNIIRPDPDVDAANNTIHADADAAHNTIDADADSAPDP